MNLPIGEITQQGVDSRKFDETKEINSLFDKLFSGYLVITIEGFGGVEEGIMIFKKGRIVGTIYEYMNYGITIFGESAIPQIFNSLAAEFGVIDVVSLTTDQVDLVIAFNDKIKLPIELGKRDVSKFFVKKFSPSYAAKVLSKVVEKQETTKTIFDKLGLSDLGR